MKNIFYYSMILGVFSSVSALAQEAQIKNVSIERTENQAIVKMDMDLSKLSVHHNRIKIITPKIVKDNDTINLRSVGVFGRTRYYYTQRNPQKNPLRSTDMQYRTGDAPSMVHYTDVIQLEPWMDGAKLYVNNRVYGCINCLLTSNNTPYDYMIPTLVVEEPVKEVYKPDFIYIRPQAELVKIRQLDATAYVNFRVSKMDIDPSYMNNTAELAKILSTIDEVRRGNKVTGIKMKGFASPESPYSNNTRLAKGRVEAIRKYVSEHEHIPMDKIQTSYEPENWEGLRAYVVANPITNKEGILKIIDSNREPDNKEAYLKQTYPSEYKYLLANCYPSLRRTDYSISYEVQHYTDIEEIKQVYKTNPGNLSIEELYVLAQSYPEGSIEFNEIFETAAKLYPNDPVANFNAASECMEAGNLEKAARYLEKAKSVPEYGKSLEILEKLRELNNK